MKAYAHCDAEDRMGEVAIVSTDSTTADRLAAIVAAQDFRVTTCTPDALPAALPALFIVVMPALASPEEQVIEQLRANETTANIPIVIVSGLPMNELQSVPYASDWTIAIVPEPVEEKVLIDTIHFLLGKE
jgi:DNA-binding response OmpR family regulator